jgi:hypothetical protein
METCRKIFTIIRTNTLFHRFELAKFAVWWFDLKLEPIFATASKMDSQYKNSHK